MKPRYKPFIIGIISSSILLLTAVPGMFLFPGDYFWFMIAVINLFSIYKNHQAINRIRMIRKKLQEENQPDQTQP